MASQKRIIGLIIFGLTITVGGALVYYFAPQVGTFVRGQFSKTESEVPVAPEEASDFLEKQLAVQQKTEEFKATVAAEQKADTTYNKINQAEQGGEINAERALMLKLWNVMDPTKVPTEYRGSDLTPSNIQLIDSGQATIDQAAAQYNKMSAENQLEINRLFSRPDGDQSDSSQQPGDSSKSNSSRPGGEYTPVSGKNFTVHYQRPEDASKATIILNNLESTVLPKVRQVGLPIPRGDGKCIKSGPDNTIDVYLVDYLEGSLGVNVICNLGIFGYRGAYILMAQDTDAEDVVFIAQHEISHSIAREIIGVGLSSLKVKSWIEEGSANYLALKVFNPLTQYTPVSPQTGPEYEYINSVEISQAYPELTLTGSDNDPKTKTGGALMPYARALFFIFYEDKFGQQKTIDFLMRLWDTNGGEEALAVAVQPDLPLEQIMQKYTEYNFKASNDYYEGYVEGRDYPIKEIEELWLDSADFPLQNQAISGVEHLGNKSVVFGNTSFKKGDGSKHTSLILSFDGSPGGEFSWQIFTAENIAGTSFVEVEDVPPGTNELIVPISDNTSAIALTGISTAEEGIHSFTYSAKFPDDSCSVPDMPDGSLPLWNVSLIAEDRAAWPNEYPNDPRWQEYGVWYEQQCESKRAQCEIPGTNTCSILSYRPDTEVATCIVQKYRGEDPIGGPSGQWNVSLDFCKYSRDLCQYGTGTSGLTCRYTWNGIPQGSNSCPIGQ